MGSACRLVSCIGNPFAVHLQGFQDVVRQLRPDKGLGVVVVDGQVVFDGLHEFPSTPVAPGGCLAKRSTVGEGAHSVRGCTGPVSVALEQVFRRDGGYPVIDAWTRAKAAPEGCA